MLAAVERDYIRELKVEFWKWSLGSDVYDFTGANFVDAMLHSDRSIPSGPAPTKTCMVHVAARKLYGLLPR